MLAHGPISPANLWTTWTLDPLMLLALVTMGALYARGLAELWKVRSGRTVSRRRAASFFAGLLLLLFALASPLDALAGELFSAHMVQHLVLMLGAAPLLVYGAPLLPVSLALPAGARRRLHSVAGSPPGRRTRRLLLALPVVWILHAVVLWMWHLPTLYELGLSNEYLHALEHATFLGTATLFWILVIGSLRRRDLDRGLAAFLTFATALQSGALGVVLTFAARPLYEAHGNSAAWGLDRFADQQLAGAIMWVPSGIVYLVTIAVLLYRWLEAMDAQPSLSSVRPLRREIPE
ncbi:MAG: cytochrome c oxidase assembly protein [Actinomycetota bacterium]